jgi:hypothetical protein
MVRKSITLAGDGLISVRMSDNLTPMGKMVGILGRSR